MTKLSNKCRKCNAESSWKKTACKYCGKEVKIKPKIVVEVAYQEIQKSPSYSSGYALRFPRVIILRYDKGANDADSLIRVRNLYKKQ